MDTKFQGSLASRRSQDILFWINVLDRQVEVPAQWHSHPQTLAQAG